MGTDLFIIWYYRYRQLTNRETAPLRSVHRLWLASPRQETDRSLQYPDAQTVEAGSVPAGFDRPAGPLSTAKDPAARRAALSSFRGKTRTGASGEGRRDRQDRARGQGGVS